MKEGDPTGKETPVTPEDLRYPDSGHGRTLCFIWPDGRLEFLNYAYLIGGKYDPTQNLIILSFTTHTVEVKGQNLHDLIIRIKDNCVRAIVCQDARYNELSESPSYIVNSISITND